MKNIIFLFITLLWVSCKDKTKKNTITTGVTPSFQLKYAKGFSIKIHDRYKVLEITSPWPNSKKVYRYALVKNNDAQKNLFSKNKFDGVISVPVKTMASTSTTHIPAIVSLKKEKTLLGFAGTNYVSSKEIRERIDKGELRDIGKNNSLNIEVILELNPELVIGFGIDGNNRALQTIAKSGIPVIFNGDWVESSPLAKAEWIKFFGVLFGKEEEAESIFNSIEKSYLEATQLVKNIKNSPTVLSGAMHSDIWYLPNGSSTEAQLLKDAHVNYLWKNTNGKGSLKLNFETVLEKAKNAHIWLSPSNYSSYDALKKANKNHSLFKAFQNKNIYTFTNTVGATGGVLYYELGMSRPDLVLKDIIKICHPKLLQDYEPYFFKPLK